MVNYEVVFGLLIFMHKWIKANAVAQAGTPLANDIITATTGRSIF